MATWKRWQDWTNALLGAWLFIGPYWIVPHGSAETWNSWIFGFLIVAAALWALNMPLSRAAEWAGATLGAWVFLAPWFLGFGVTPAAWMSWIIGALVFILSLSVLNGQKISPTQASRI
jgi:hypothetical protein